MSGKKAAPAKTEAPTFKSGKALPCIEDEDETESPSKFPNPNGMGGGLKENQNLQNKAK